MLVIELVKSACITKKCIWIALQRGLIGFVVRAGNVELEPRLVLATHHRLGRASFGIDSRIKT